MHSGVLIPQKWGQLQCLHFWKAVLSKIFNEYISSFFFLTFVLNIEATNKVKDPRRMHVRLLSKCA